MRKVLLAFLLMAGVASAQTTSPAPAPSASAPAAPVTHPARAHRTLQDRFDEANTTNDGRLTPEQARSKMPAVSRNFATIDATNKGYVTVEDIKAYNRARRAARKAAKQSAAQEKGAE